MNKIIIFLLAAVTCALTLEVSFGNEQTFVATYPNNTIVQYDYSNSKLNNNGNVDVYFADMIFIEWPNGKNMTFWKFPEKVYPPHGNEESCNIGCDGYSCSGHSIPSQGCTCGCTWCCYNNDKGYYYLCPSDSAACCHGSSYDSYGCAVSTGCKSCDF